MSSIFLEEYKIAINNIIKNIYGSDYYGFNDEGVYGVVKPITNLDHPTWSNYNFINTNNLVMNHVIIPYISKINKECVDNLNYNQSYKENKFNRHFFSILWKERINIFGVGSITSNEIIKIITNSRKKGERIENLTKLALESLPNTVVTKTSKDGGIKDFIGIDLDIDSTVFNKIHSTAQVKSFSNISNQKKNWYITAEINRGYNTDLLIFTRKENDRTHVAVFINDPKRIVLEPNRVIIPIDLIKALINYDYVNKKSDYKLY